MLKGLVLLQLLAFGAPSDELLELRREKARCSVEIERLRREISRLQLELDAAKQTIEAERQRADAAVATAEQSAREALEAPAAIEESDVAVEELDLPDLVPPQPTQAAPSASPPSSAPAPPPSTPVSPEARRLYDNGYSLFHEANYDAARAAFESFLGQFGRTDLADNAQFWIGECHYAEQSYEAALTAFMKTVEDYPRGNKVPDALVKAGKSLERLGDLQAAVETYEEILSRFADSAAAVAATERLEKLRR